MLVSAISFMVAALCEAGRDGDRRNLRDISGLKRLGRRRRSSPGRKPVQRGGARRDLRSEPRPLATRSRAADGTRAGCSKREAPRRRLPADQFPGWSDSQSPCADPRACHDRRITGHACARPRPFRRHGGGHGLGVVGPAEPSGSAPSARPANAPNRRGIDLERRCSKGGVPSPRTNPRGISGDAVVEDGGKRWRTTIEHCRKPHASQS